REYSDFAVNYRDRDHALHTKRFQAGEIEPNLPVTTPQEMSWRLSHLADFLREPAYAVLRHRYGHTPALDQNLWRIGDGLENFGLSPFQDTRILEHLTLN